MRCSLRPRQLDVMLLLIARREEELL
jgi:hypothetical protein